MALYHDAYLLIDTRVVAVAQPMDGDGPHDGTYLLMLYIGVGSNLEQMFIVYPTLQARNEAFENLSRLRRTDHPLPLSLDFDLDTEASDEDE